MQGSACIAYQSSETRNQTRWDRQPKPQLLLSSAAGAQPSSWFHSDLQLQM